MVSLLHKNQPRLVVIAAPSGTGKTTLCEMLLKEFPNFTLSISTTTRSQRPNEKAGTHYHFVTREEFQKKIERGDFAEHAEVHGNLYGTSKKVVEEAIQSGKHLLFDIDVQGAMSLLKHYGNRVLLVFIHPPSMQILEQRLRDRKGDSLQAIEKRLQNAYNEVAWSPKFQYQITNDDLRRAYQELKQIIQKECA